RPLLCEPVAHSSHVSLRKRRTRAGFQVLLECDGPAPVRKFNDNDDFPRSGARGTRATSVVVRRQSCGDARRQPRVVPRSIGRGEPRRRKGQRARAAGLTLTAVVADAEYGDNRTVRQMLHRLRLPYALGISPTLTVFRGTPTLRVDRAQPPPRSRSGGWPDQ